MNRTSKTGLQASSIKKIYKLENTIEPPLQLKATAKPVPFYLKPLATLYNPYPYGCSLLCNHPTDCEMKELLKKAKATDSRNLLLPEEIDNIRRNMHQVQLNSKNNCSNNNPNLPVIIDIIPEELFRRYTETDSRPVTPPPTFASATTRASGGSRRCLTPDPRHVDQEKTLLVLDLRRSHSQETISMYASSSMLELPLIRIQQVPTRTTSLEDLSTVKERIGAKPKLPGGLSAPPTIKPPRPRTLRVATTQIEVLEQETGPTHAKTDVEDEEEEFVRRRGKKRRKKGKRDASRSLVPFQTATDPETQVETVGIESRNASSRQSLAGDGSVKESRESSMKQPISSRYFDGLDCDSYLSKDILKELRRELTEDMVEMEFNIKRRRALQEALKTIPENRIDSDALIDIQKELSLPPVNTELWLSLPRFFSRSSARFELPMDSRSLESMTPLEYVKEHVSISNSRKMLYTCIFNKLKCESEEMEKNKITGEKLQEALDLMMGKRMTDDQSNYFRDLVDWRDDGLYDFKTFCGVCALCERLLAAEFYPNLPGPKEDPCNRIETADFGSLTRRLEGKNVENRLVKILYGIKNS